MPARICSWAGLILLAALLVTGCRRSTPQKVDEQGHAIVEGAAKVEQDSLVLQQQILQEMKDFDQAVEQWMIGDGLQAENQPVDLARIAPRLTGRLGQAIQDGRLMDPVGNAYVILPLDPGSNVRITVSSETASRPEFEGMSWGDHAPR
jgi:hypothetical protein